MLCLSCFGCSFLSLCWCQDVYIVLESVSLPRSQSSIPLYLLSKVEKTIQLCPATKSALCLVQGTFEFWQMYSFQCCFSWARVYLNTTWLCSGTVKPSLRVSSALMRFLKQSASIFVCVSSVSVPTWGRSSTLLSFSARSLSCIFGCRPRCTGLGRLTWSVTSLYTLNGVVSWANSWRGA